tara:strand:- start:1 stop:225 length:225 start_codon:yes stop_codon:yes gene_type:complete
MSKPKFVEACYTQAIRFDVDDIDWDNVEDYWVKWATLNIEMQNGDIIEIESSYDYDIDWKHPDDVQVYEGNEDE